MGFQFNKPVVPSKIYRDVYTSDQGYPEPVRLLAPYVQEWHLGQSQMASAAVTGIGRGGLGLVSTGTAGTNTWQGRTYDTTLKKNVLGLKISVNAATVLDAGFSSFINDFEFSTGLTAVGRSKLWCLNNVPFDYYMKVKLDTIPAGAANQDKGSAFFGLFCPLLSSVAAVQSVTTTQAVDMSANFIGFRIAGVTTGTPVWAVHYNVIGAAGSALTMTHSLASVTPSAAAVSTSTAWTLLRMFSPDGRRVIFSINDTPVKVLDSRDGSSRYDMSHATDDSVPSLPAAWAPLGILSKANTNYDTTWQARCDYVKMAMAPY